MEKIKQFNSIKSRMFIWKNCKFGYDQVLNRKKAWSYFANKNYSSTKGDNLFECRHWNRKIENWTEVTSVWPKFMTRIGFGRKLSIDTELVVYEIFLEIV